MSILIKNLNIIYITSFWKSNISNELNVPETITDYINFRVFLNKNFPDFKVVKLDELNNILPNQLKIVDEISPGLFITENNEIINYDDYFDGNNIPSGIKGFVLYPKFKLLNNNDLIENYINYVAIELVNTNDNFLTSKKEYYCLLNFSHNDIYLNNLKDEFNLNYNCNYDLTKDSLYFILGKDEDVLNDYLNNDSFIVQNKKYNNFKEACNKLDLNYESILNLKNYFKNNKFSLEYYIDLFLTSCKKSGYSNKSNNLDSSYYDFLKYKFYYNNINFDSLYSACIHFKLDYEKIVKYKQNKNLLNEEVLEYFLNNEQEYDTNKYIFLNEEFDSFLHCCNYYDFAPSTIYHYAERNNITKEEALISYLTGNLIYKQPDTTNNKTKTKKISKKIFINNKIFASLNSCCNYYNISKNIVVSYAKSNNISNEEALLFFIPEEIPIEYFCNKTKQKNKIIFMNKVFSSFVEACKYYKISRDAVNHYAKNKNITKEEALAYYLFKDKKDKIEYINN